MEAESSYNTGTTVQGPFLLVGDGRSNRQNTWKRFSHDTLNKMLFSTEQVGIETNEPTNRDDFRDIHPVYPFPIGSETGHAPAVSVPQGLPACGNDIQ